MRPRGNNLKLMRTGLFILASALLFVPATSQGQGSTPEERWAEFRKLSVDDLIARLRSKPGDLIVTQRLRELGDKRAIPALRDAFKRVSEKTERQAIASVLVELGEPDVQYWNFLVRFAKQAIESPIPFPLLADAQGRYVKGKFDPAFLDWCRQNNTDPQATAYEALYSLPGDVAQLALARDARGFDLLLRGLGSTNAAVVAESARGLALLRDKRAIRPIIAAARRLPAEAGEEIARNLVLFDDSEAQAAAEQLIQNKAILEYLRKKAKEAGPRGVLGF